MRASAPASSANLGPGFDVLALALCLRVEVTVSRAAALSVTTEGEGADVPQDASHLAVRVAAAVAGHDRLEIAVRSDIPLGRGLGSSAALAVAAAAAAGAPDPLAVASSFDGHAENAAASLLGGLVAATQVDGHPVARRLRLDPDLVFVLLIPERRLPTAEARAALPTEVGLGDAVFNLGRLGLLVAGLADATLLSHGHTGDRLHQDARAAAFFPEAPELLARLVEGGALASSWSGAGTSLIGICRRESSAQVRDAGEAALGSCGVTGRAIVLEADDEGLRLDVDESH